MEISKPTLYAASGDKEALLREAVGVYMGVHADAYATALNLPTARQVIEAWLRLTGGVREEADVPPGCLLVQGALIGSQASQVIQQELAFIRNEGTRYLEERLQKSQDGRGPARNLGARPACNVPLRIGLRISRAASGGVSFEVLNLAVDQLMANWPD